MLQNRLEGVSIVQEVKKQINFDDIIEKLAAEKV